MDDLPTGVNTKQEAIQIRNEVIDVLSQGCFKLRKWAQNDTSLLKDLQKEDNSSVLILDKHETVKTLGLQLNSQRDMLQFSVPAFDTSQRIILSELSQVFGSDKPNSRNGQTHHPKIVATQVRMGRVNPN